MTPKPENIIHIDQKEPLAPTCDHNMIELELHQTSMNVKTPSIRNFYRRNYKSINKFLSGVD